MRFSKNYLIEITLFEFSDLDRVDGSIQIGWRLDYGQ